MDLQFDAVYYEPAALDYELGKQLLQKFPHLPWVKIENHNLIPELTAAENSAFPRLKNHLVVGVRKTHNYVPNHKVSDWLVPYTSSGCRAMCLYCYLVCHYNKCSYLRLFVNREEMLRRLIRKAATSETPQTFEIGSNSDLVLENTITSNLVYTIERFSREGRGKLTFPTKFDMVQPLLRLDHREKVIFRMSVNPEEIIRRVELGTSPLDARIRALNAMADAGYPVGMLIAPVILVQDWKRLYGALIDRLSDSLSPAVRQKGFIEIILMTYSFVHRAINAEAFPKSESLYDPGLMTGRGRGRYRYRDGARAEAEAFFRQELAKRLPKMDIVYVS